MCKTMANICRLCGKIGDHAMFIFENDDLKLDIVFKIRVGLDIQISPDDPLSKHACVCCLDKLDQFWIFRKHCKRVQTSLRRLLPEHVPFESHNISCDQHQNPKTSTEESSAHIEVLETLGDSTDNDVNNPREMNSNNYNIVEFVKVKLDAHFVENSLDSFRSTNESNGNACEPSGNDQFVIETDLLVATQNGIRMAGDQLDSHCQDKEENMAISSTEYTSETSPEDKPVIVEGECEVQNNRVSEKADSRSATCVHGIDATLCLFKRCCVSHPFDKYWKKSRSRFCCLLCDFFTVRSNEIRNHVSSHVSLNVYECSICSKKFRSYTNLKLHMKIHSKKSDRSSLLVHGVFSCEHCSKTFNSKTNLRRHKIRICGNGSVSCPDCGLRFSSLNRHKFLCPGNNGFVCDICNKSYKRKNALIQHIQTHEQGEYGQCKRE